MAQMEHNNCYMPIGKSESEMTNQEKITMREFDMIIQAYRLSDRVHWDTQLSKAQCNAYDAVIKSFKNLI